ncbi:MAG: hypothetical protein FWD57_02340, partial [Polyangiaceae bacterium]|nr:hypothetical protein [Polyangiaceae bacterium]
GHAHTCAIDKDGAAKCWGSNESGQVGNGNTSDKSALSQVSNLGSDVTAVSAGFNHTCALKKSGAVLCWGDNSTGQLGVSKNDPKLSNIPIEVQSLHSNVSAISAHNGFTCAIRSTGDPPTGELLCWGENILGQIGEPKPKLYSHVPEPVPIKGSTGISAVSTGNNHACVLTSTGTALCWGDFRHGRLGYESNTAVLEPTRVDIDSTFAQISAGYSHTCAITSSGAARCWGQNSDGALGTETKKNITKPELVIDFQ